MKTFQILIRCITLGLLVSACQSRGNDISGLESAVANPNSELGVAVLSYTVNNRNCEAKVLVEGVTRAGTQHSEQIWSGIGATFSPRKYMLAKLPAGDYKIKKIDCPGVYKVAGLLPLARFSIASGTVNNLHVLEINQTSSAGNRSGISKKVRPFKKSELSSFKARHPKLHETMIDNPMSVNLQQEDLDKVKKLIDDVIAKKNANEPIPQ